MLKSRISSISVHHVFSTRWYFKIPATVMLQYLFVFHDYANVILLKVVTDV